MINFFKKSKIFIFFLIFAHVSSIAASTPIYKSTTQSYFANKGNIMKQLYNEDGLLVFDLVMRLLYELEEELLVDVATEQDWYEISYFLAFLARSGTLPNASEEEKAELEKDIQELLSPYENGEFENSSYRASDYQIMPAIYYQGYDVILCRNWFQKKFKKVGKYIKKHKKAFIIGSTVVVAAVAVVATVAIATSVAATSAAAAKSCSQKSKKEEVTSFDNSNSYSQDSTLYQSFDDQISNYKDTIIENNIPISNSKDQYLNTNNERIIGSTLAHGAIENIPKYISSDTYEQIINQGHGKIDSVFSTNQALFYMDKNNTLDSLNKDFQENFFRHQGHQALNTQYYDKAIDSFGKAIETNPSNYNIYLDRAYAYLKDGQFDNSLNDYQVYTEQKKNNIEQSTTFVDCFDFSIGVTNGIAKGAATSGKQIISFAANTITHPIDTAHGIYIAFSNIAKLAYFQEWQELSQTLAPEVCYLINNWEKLSPKEKGKQSGYIIGKYGTDILIPGATAKAISKGIKGAKELAILAKNIQRTEKVVVLEALATTGGNSGTFAKKVYTLKAAEKVVPHASVILKNIRRGSVKTKSGILKIVMPNGQRIGKKGTSSFVRLFKGNQNEARQVFKKLTKKGKLIKNSPYPGKLYALKDGTKIGFRSFSKSGPPTIDLDIPGFADNLKLKFMGN